MGWISIKDKKPAVNVTVLVSTNDGVGVACYGPWGDFEHVYINWQREMSSYTVTHWMPLPEPPIKE